MIARTWPVRPCRPPPLRRQLQPSCALPRLPWPAFRSQPRRGGLAARPCVFPRSPCARPQRPSPSVRLPPPWPAARSPRLRCGFRGGAIPFGLLGPLLGFGSLALGLRGLRLLLGFRRPGAALVVFALLRCGLFGPARSAWRCASSAALRAASRSARAFSSRSWAALFKRSIRCCAVIASGESGKRLMNLCSAADRWSPSPCPTPATLLSASSRLGGGGCGSAARLTLPLAC